MCAGSLASLVPAVCIPAGAVCVPGPSHNPATINPWHPLFLSLVGMEALEPAGKSCGSFGAAREVLWGK